MVGVIAATQFDRDGSGFQLTETHTWIDAFGVHYAVGLDGLGLLLVLLTVVLVPIVLLAAWNDSPDDECKPWFAWALALEALSLVVFLVDRRVPLLRRLRGDADPGVLPHRWLRPREALGRRAEVPDVPARPAGWCCSAR